MSEPSIRAMVSWLRPEKGGASRPPGGARIVCPAAIWANPGCHQAEWSLVVNCVRIYNAGPFVLADVRFLVAEAPHAVLRDGARFGLFEGRKLFAIGLVRPSAGVTLTADDFRAALPC